jgi:dienelactone hydrolase
MVKRLSFVVLIVCVLLPGSVLAQGQIDFPEPTGPYPVGRVSYHLIDESRDETFTEDPNDVRELMVTVYYPATECAEPGPYVSGVYRDTLAEIDEIPVALFDSVHSYACDSAPIADEEFPVLMFSPGMGGMPSYYTSLLEDVTSHGYIIAAIYHTYSGEVTVFPEDRVVLSTENANLVTMIESGMPMDQVETAFESIGIVWVQDAQFVLDQLTQMNEADALLQGHLDLEHVGSFGHSFGGAMSAEVLHDDSRFDAGINMDGTLFGAVRDEGLSQPFMFMLSDRMEVPQLSEEELATAGMTQEQFEADYLAQQDEYELRPMQTVYESASNGYKLILLDSVHNTYVTDLSVANARIPGLLPADEVGTIDGLVATDTIRAYVVAFFDTYLKGIDEPLMNGPSAEYVEFESHAP